MDFLKNNLDNDKIIDDSQEKYLFLLKNVDSTRTSKLQFRISLIFFEYMRANFTSQDRSDHNFKEIIAFLSNQFPAYTTLARIYKVLLLTSVECERTFNEQNRIKTKFRTSMGDNLLGSLINLGINTPQMLKKNILLKRSIKRWKEEKERYFLKPDLQEELRYAN